MIITIDTAYNTVYENAPHAIWFLFKFIDKEDLIESLKRRNPTFKVTKTARYSYIERKFNVIDNSPEEFESVYGYPPSKAGIR